MTDGTTIGELSRLTAVPVRTIRFYCDEGLLPARRSPGGHRIFDASAVESLLLIRRLRAIGLGLDTIVDVLAARVTVGEAVAAEGAAVEAEMNLLAWRRASLAAVEHASPAERPARLQLLSAVQHARQGHGVLVEFWRRLFAGATSPETFEDYVQMTVPQPPAEPNPAGVVAYAELVALVQQRAFASIMARQLWRFEPTAITDRRGLLGGVAEACDMAMPLVLAGQPPSTGPAVDRFVDAHARARREKDTPGFRRALIGNAGVDNDPRIGRYWGLVAEIAGETATVGSAQRWLFEALRCPITQTA